MTTSWNGTSLPDPEGWEDALKYTGKQAVTADGATHFDINARYRQVAIRWTNITRAQAEAIRTEALTMAQATLILASLTTLSAFPMRNTFRMATVGGASALYDVTVSVYTTDDGLEIGYWYLDAGYDLDDGLSFDTPID